MSSTDISEPDDGQISHEGRFSTRRGVVSRLEVAGIWLLGHASGLWPALMFAIVLGLSWGALSHVNTRDFRSTFHDLNSSWLAIAAAMTIVNVGVMGLYDLVAFRHTRAPRWTRWRYGAVTFAWSNFLTLGPIAGPAIRFWLYRPVVDQLSDLSGGVLSITVAFSSGLAGWTLAVLIGARTGNGAIATSAMAFALSLIFVWGTLSIARRTARFAAASGDRPVPILALAAIGWLDWLLGAAAFIACIAATGAQVNPLRIAESFFLGQAVGLVSLMPGGFGSGDLFWLAHVPIERSTAAAALVAYRLVYYVLPWAIASLALLNWATTRAPRRLEIARRVAAALVGGGGILIILSSASPALQARLVALEQVIPLPLVELGQVTAALAGLVLVVLARGLARGYRSAFRGAVAVLVVAGLSAILKGLDWEEATILGLLAAAAATQSNLFRRPTRSDWLEGRDLPLAFAALALFVLVGVVAHRVDAETLARWTSIGYRLEGARFVRTVASMTLVVLAGGLYVWMRARADFVRPGDADIERALGMHADWGVHTNPLMVTTGDKAIFFDSDRGFCLYRTVGPYLVVFADPVVRAEGDRESFLTALETYCAELDRRPLWYQISAGWIPALHDRGYDFFKLGEEAYVHLDHVTLEGHAGKMNRQLLKRAERDGLRFRVLEPPEVAARLEELSEISDAWLEHKGLVERGFSIGFFEKDYLCRFRCAVVEEARPGGRLLGFANLLEGPHRQELSVDLMRYRSGGPSIMDFLMVSLFLEGKASGYARFNLGVAPLAAVGDKRGAHLRERFARLLFQRGEHWYQFQGLRRYKEKFDPEWLPRYMAYRRGLEWPTAIACVSALSAGGWGRIFLAARPPTPTVPRSQAHVQEAGAA